MNEYHFNTAVARLYGVDEAIFLHAVAFWVTKNVANHKHFHDGRYWTYNTQTALAALFPFWSRKQIGRITESCKKQGALLVGNYNEQTTTRTLWYTLGDAVVPFYAGTAQSIAPNGEMEAPQGIAETAEADAPIVPNGTMQIPKRDNALPQTAQCIRGTVIYPDSIPPTPHGGTAAQKSADTAFSDELFERFWNAYPKKASKKKAQSAWRKLKPDLALCRSMAAALERFRSSDEWVRGFVPYPASWLNARRWEDETIKPYTGDGGGGGNGGKVIGNDLVPLL